MLLFLPIKLNVKDVYGIQIVASTMELLPLEVLRELMRCSWLYGSNVKVNVVLMDLWTDWLSRYLFGTFPHAVANVANSSLRCRWMLANVLFQFSLGVGVI